MENFSREDKTSLFGMEVDDQAKNVFLEMSRWTKFLSILGFVCLGMMILGGFGIAAFISSNNAISSQMGPMAAMGSIGIIIYFIVIAALSFYPIWALYKYSTGIKTAVKTNDKARFNEAITYLKGMFKYWGIFMLILLGLYGVIMIFGIIGSAM